MPVISIENDPAKQRVMLPEGIYVLTCKHCEAAPRKDQEIEIVLKCDVVSCTDRSANGKQATPRLGTKFTTAIKALLEHTGVPFTEPMGAGGKPTIQFDTDHLVGKTFQVECKHNGNWERWSNFAPAGVMQQQPAAAAPYTPPPQTAPAPHLPAPQPHVPPQGTPVHPGYAPAGHPAPGYGAPQVAPQGAPGVAPHQPAPGYPPAGGYPGATAPGAYPGAPAPGAYPGTPAPGYPQAVPVQGAPAPGAAPGAPPPGYIPPQG